ncbi:hypothetical protein BJY01DRAFT_126643 [Aspergillus pseudoustus]|uniref:Secreted protein n=1 Tax=Aspergillus pseudoustus TaxID=1810923 RepID=A0ABR4IMW1_9EURO
MHSIFVFLAPYSAGFSWPVLSSSMVSPTSKVDLSSTSVMDRVRYTYGVSARATIRTRMIQSVLTTSLNPSASARKLNLCAPTLSGESLVESVFLRVSSKSQTQPLLRHNKLSDT